MVSQKDITNRQILNSIRSKDKFAQALLRKIYAMVKEDKLDSAILELIESAYSDVSKAEEMVIDELLSEARRILNSSEKQERHAELLAALEEITFLAARDKIFRPHFNGIEEAVASALQLDFGKRAPLSEIGESRQNIINYTSVVLNTVLEKLEGSVVSVKVVEALLVALGAEDMGILVTDENLQIRYANTQASEFIGIQNLTSCDLKQLVVHPELLTAPSVGFIGIEFKEPFGVIHVLFRPAETKGAEIREYIFLLSKQAKVEKEAALKLYMETSSQVEILNRFIGGANYIKKNYQGNDENIGWIASEILDQAWQMKETLQGSLKALVKTLPEGHEPVLFAELIQQVADSFGTSAQIELTDNSTGAFIGDPVFLKDLLQNVVSYGLHCKEGSGLLQMGIENWERKGVLIRLTWPVSKSKTYSNEFRLVKGALQKLGGDITCNLAGGVIELRIPNYNGL